MDGDLPHGSGFSDTAAKLMDGEARVSVEGSRERGYETEATRPKSTSH